MSSFTGDKIKLALFGESHGEAVGCVIDGLPAGVRLDTESIRAEMARRAPGRDGTASARREEDAPQILSGVLDGVTTGAPLAVVIKNTDVRSEDYAALAAVPRPSHGDYPAYVKHGGKNDGRGGGHGSGRLTAPLVFAGAVAKQLLKEKGVTVGAHLSRIGSVCDSDFDLNHIDITTLERLSAQRFPVLDAAAEDAMRAEIERFQTAGDSIGGEIECAAIGVPAGLGAPFFDTVESRLSALLFAIPAIKGVAFGLGFDFTKSNGAAANDGYEIKDGTVCLCSNNNGGVLGGMTSGAPLVFRAAVKPTPSIAKTQQSVNLRTMENTVISVRGRHDACLAPRALPAVEAATALVLLDLMI